jgi:hypothetical protein
MGSADRVQLVGLEVDECGLFGVTIRLVGKVSETAESHEKYLDNWEPFWKWDRESADGVC